MEESLRGAGWWHETSSQREGPRDDFFAAVPPLEAKKEKPRGKSENLQR